MDEKLLQEAREIFPKLAEQKAVILLRKSDDDRVDELWKLNIQPSLETTGKKFKSWQEYVGVADNTKWSEVDWDEVKKELFESPKEE